MTLIRPFLAVLFAFFATSLIARPGPPGETPSVAGVLTALPITGEATSSDKEVPPIVLPLTKTEVQLSISGGLVEAEVTQVFVNNTDHPLEAIYVFPLPSESTVTSMELRVGERVIRSLVKERDQARQEYESARTEGRKAALLEQERPNVFTTSVSNFNPGETVRIRFNYLQAADYQRGAYGITFPLVVGPRYIPQDPRVPDAARISPPLLHPTVPAGHAVSVKATITGLPVKAITSTTHEILTTSRDGGKTYEVVLKEGETLPNADFHFEIALAGGAEPEVSVTTAEAHDSTFALVDVFPPLSVPEDKLPPRVPRDVLFLIDTSGSMQGESISQAQAGLSRCLEMLQPEDTFTIVRFSGDYSSFAPSLGAATPERLESARAYVKSLRADGGTEMQPALDYTLSIPSERENVLRLVVFLTDGDVGNEASLMQLLHAKLGAARVFTFGIGSAPNEFLMRRLAEIGRGESRFIRSHEDIGSVMSGFFRTLDQPALTNVHLQWRGKDGKPATELAAYPQPCPDVFVDRPLQVVAKLPQAFDGTLEVTGQVAGGSMTYKFPVGAAARSVHGGIPTLFGQALVNDLMYQRLRTTSDPELKSLRDKVVRTALDYQLVTEFTSRIAVEEKITRTPDGKLLTVNVPTMLPRGWSPNAFFRTATNDPLLLLLGLVAIAGGLLLILRPASRSSRA